MAREYNVESITNALKGAWSALWAPKYGSDTTMQAIEAENGALYVANKTINAGDRSSDSETGLDYQAVAGEWRSQTLTVTGTGDLEVWPGPAVVRMVRVRKCTDAGVATANTAGIIIVKDDTVVKEAAAAAATPGTAIFDGLDGTLFGTRFVINFANTSDSLKIEVLYKPLDPLVTWMN